MIFKEIVDFFEYPFCTSFLTFVISTKVDYVVNWWTVTENLNAFLKIKQTPIKLILFSDENISSHYLIKVKIHQIHASQF